MVVTHGGGLAAMKVFMNMPGVDLETEWLENGNRNGFNRKAREAKRRPMRSIRAHKWMKIIFG